MEGRDENYASPVRFEEAWDNTDEHMKTNWQARLKKGFRIWRKIKCGRYVIYMRNK